MKTRILVIEDEKDVRELLADILTDEGHEVEISSNGREGLKAFKDSTFDLVFTDLGMPVMDGWEVAEKIKKISYFTPISVITGWKVKADDSELQKRGVDFIINKPFQIKQILQLVQDSMQLRQKLANN
jgi:CheY-like chemotaxis protein